MGPRERNGRLGAGKDGKSGGGRGDQSFVPLCVTPVLGLIKSEGTLDIVQSGFGLPTCLAHTVFKCLN